jgi:hypothetical protein
MSVERSDLSPRAASWALAGLLALLALSGGIVAAFLAVCGHLREPSPPPPKLRLAPMLQVNEPADRVAIEARARAKLAANADAMRRTAAAGWDNRP